MRPTSRGHVKLRSKDPRQHPEILFNYVQTEGVRLEIRAAIRLTREIFAQKAFDPHRGVELSPGSAVKSDAEIDARGESAYYPSATCKMGIDSDPMAVVDAAGRVHGLEALWVVNASLMPHVVSGNLNASPL